MTGHQDDATALFELDGSPDSGRAPRPPRAPRSRWRPGILAAGVVVVLAAAIAVAVAVTHGSRQTSAATSIATSVATSAATAASAGPSAGPASSPPAGPAAQTAPGAAWATTDPGPARTIPAEQLAAETADLQRTAALLTSRVRLTSPASWDQWLPKGKDYQAESGAEAMATCPKIASRLSQGLGQPMSYWTGTLPLGPNGCDWVDEPLTYDNPARYAYVLNIGFLDDGSTTESWRHHFYEHQGAICPAVDVPAVASGAILVRCADPGVSYWLVLPDSRTPGLWFVAADVRPNATRPAADVFTTLLDAAAGAFGG